MYLNSYMAKDYMQTKILRTFLTSDRLERRLAEIHFYTREMALPTRSFILIRAEQLTESFPAAESVCFLCIGNVRKEELPEGADLLIFEEGTDILELYKDIQNVFLLFEQLEQTMNHLFLEEAPLNSYGNAIMAITRNPVCLYSEDMRLLFFSEQKKELKYRLFLDSDINHYLPDSDIEELKIDKEYNATMDAIDPAIFSANHWGYRILYYNIRFDGVYVARLMFCETDRPLNDSDDCLLLYLAEYISHAMRRKNLTFNNHPRYLDECIQKLLLREEVNPSHLASTFQDLGWQTDDRFLCAVFLSSQYDQNTFAIAPITLRLENSLPGSIALPKNNTIIVLINLSRSTQTKEVLLQQLVYLLRENMMKVGISREFFSIAETADYYRQALTALRIGNQQDEMFWCYYYEKYALQDLIASAKDGRCLSSVLPAGLQCLMEYDARNNRQFTHTLKIYLRQNMHIAETIRILYMQRATFLYQLKRILEISGLKLDDPKVRLELLIAFEILEQEGPIVS